jgi:hypothetical protein
MIEEEGPDLSADFADDADFGEIDSQIKIRTEEL